jgi:hypothetical protein
MTHWMSVKATDQTSSLRSGDMDFFLPLDVPHEPCDVRRVQIALAAF